MCEHEERGLLAPTKNIEQIALSLERFIQDREFAKKVGQQLRAHVVQHFSHSKMIAETGRLYGLV
jgi:glycosyltransferase involved in cell wall biosynthesis